MPSPSPDFAVAAQRWHDFYLLLGGAAATLSGLMFVAVTFGAGLVTDDNAPTMRAFADPPLFHFVHVIVTAAVFVMPTMTTPIFGWLLAVGVAGRFYSLRAVYRHYHDAHRRHGDLELSDWLMGIVLPGGSFVALLACAYGFATGRFVWFSVLAGATLAILLIGLRSTWELMLWLITELSRRGKSR